MEPVNNKSGSSTLPIVIVAYGTGAKPIMVVLLSSSWALVV
jgi:hypothetical protein